MTEDSLTTQAIIEAFRKRVKEKDDRFELRGSQITIRCFQPDKHKNADSHLSATYDHGEYAKNNFKEDFNGRTLNTIIN